MSSAAAPFTRIRPRFTLRELAGGFGDIGLLLPLAIALVTVNGLGATAVFGSAGIAYVATAWYFGLPLPVQPLKAFAATAIALQLDAATIAAGALLMAGAMALITVGNAAERLAGLFPMAIVRGIQLSVALLLARSAWTMAEKGNWSGLPDPAGWVGPAVAAAALVALVVLRRRAFPTALAILAAGLGIGLALGGLPDGLAFGPSSMAVGLPPADVYATALTTLVLAQLPLTFGNSIVATTDVCRTYYGDGAARVRPTRLAGSMAIWNTLSGLTGGLPVCHGAGGATAHHAMGARTGGATMMVGGALLAAALVAGSGATALAYMVFPGALAGMLAYVAVQHAGLAAQLIGRYERVVAATVGAGTLAMGNLAWGVGVGAVLLAGRAVARRVVRTAAMP